MEASDEHATRERLVRAAIALIPRLGWGEVTTRKVAAHAGVRPGVVHYHFASVSDLLGEAAVRSTRETLAAPMAALASAEDLRSGLDILLSALDTTADDASTVMLMAESLLAATRDAGLRARLHDLLGEFRGEVTAWLRRHTGDEHAEATAAVLLAALDGALLHRTVDPSLPTDALRLPLERLVTAGSAS